MSYHHIIRINQKEAAIVSIAGLKDLTPYEQEIASFLEEWFSEKNYFILNTSGSTGTPKSIEIERTKMIASATATINYLHITEGTPVTVCIDARFIGGKMQIVRALTHDLPLQIVTPTSNLVNALSRFDTLGLISLVPLQLYSILDQDPARLDKASAILIGGAPIESKYMQAIAQLANPVYHTYGMTETISHIALKRLNSHPPQNDFTVLPGIQIKTDNRDCLIINGAITGGMDIITNDIVTLTSKQSFHWQGRYDEVVNSGGIKIFPSEIDRLIATHVNTFYPNHRYFCYGLSDHKLGQKLVLFIEGEDALVSTKLLQQIKEALPNYHAPKQILFSRQFRSTASGKLDKIKTVHSILS